jgi:hypothetical protein
MTKDRRYYEIFNFQPAHGVTPIKRMIDQATWRDRAFVEQHIAWFNGNVWGEE